ncbi:monomeric archaeal DNA polymerase sliding clamp [Methanocella conradii HZ254]|uniref:DNA polymerase sliding clamp n=1 Tax=Methanocella conradii (strain DSM 24694 / JCM 17849 / CGMCC 1.5162 / HZ254) TaxID=1041930 RepID=H8I9H9_METCZ|nr:proliferating cell nuclear antigen (pcna) [Methanocella conradii]AFD00024.1 monomeric archaeal DNA polymerase sliding clamp [Methanocella conradii HZ254]MDI6896158.1 proliferating cell nuclear antigen (pcna) [Methanocella conradii]
MFKAVINAEVLKDAIEAVSTLVDEAKFRITKDGMSARAVDPANVAMVSFEISSKAFESYDATDGEIGVDLTRLNDILGMASKDDKVELNLNEETRKLEIRTGGLAYTLSLLDPSSIRKEPKVPNLELPAKIVLNGAELRRAVKAAEKVSDHMALGVVDKTFYIEAEGDLDKVRLDIPESGLISIQSSGNVRSLFSLDYLNDLVKSLGKAERVAIDLGTDYPVRFTFSIAGGNGSVTYLLAPRIESE